MTTIDLRRDDRVLRVTLDRPHALNAIDEEMLAGLAEVVRIARTDAGLRAVVISGRGEAFCVGLDVDLLERAFADVAYFRDVLERFNRTLLDLEELDVPVVAAVNGTTRAGGFELVLACDLVLIVEEARIGDVHTRFGVMPGGGATQRAPRKLGPQRAAELIMTSRWLTGAEAVAYGIALRAVPRARLDAAVDEFVGALVDTSRSSIGAVKR
ncbi:MAG: enoyl-CoA hydratase/isomerase family protein, partial [Actinobacteria bacterium]|nr:enoyl-CoA hydratase/isomerase family protein [Actinomycetota bacterium]